VLLSLAFLLGLDFAVVDAGGSGDAHCHLVV
jgi:hypothetical protein